MRPRSKIKDFTSPGGSAALVKSLILLAREGPMEETLLSFGLVDNRGVIRVIKIKDFYRQYRRSKIKDFTSPGGPKA
jgi:hypothetical protein